MLHHVITCAYRKQHKMLHLIQLKVKPPDTESARWLHSKPEATVSFSLSTGH